MHSYFNIRNSNSEKLQPYQTAPLYNHLYAALVTALRDPATFSTFIVEEYWIIEKRDRLFAQHYYSKRY